MTKYTEIKAGYRISVTSWENDADNYNTVVKDGLSKNEVIFLKALFELVDDSDKFGNMFDPSESEIDELNIEVRKIVESNLGIADGGWKNILAVSDSQTSAYYYTDILSDYGLSGGDYFTRVMDKFVVEYIPETIRIEDVTDQF